MAFFIGQAAPSAKPQIVRAGNDADRVADLQQQVEIAQPPSTGLDPFEHGQRPGRSFAAGRALAAAFVLEEPATVVQEIDHRNGFVHHDDGRGAQAQAADLAGTGEIERRIEFAFREQSHADAAGNRRFRFAALPHAAAIFVDQLPAGDAQRRFVATGLVDVPAEAIQLRPVAAGIARIFRVGRNADRS